MKKIRTDLQEKIDKITPNIGDKVKETQDTASDYQNTEEDKTDKIDNKEDEKENGTRLFDFL